jgi:hypothetical protein
MDDFLHAERGGSDLVLLLFVAWLSSWRAMARDGGVCVWVGTTTMESGQPGGDGGAWHRSVETTVVRRGLNAMAWHRARDDVLVC